MTQTSEQIPAVDIPLSKNIKVNIEFFSSIYQESSDVVFRPIIVEKKKPSSFT